MPPPPGQTVQHGLAGAFVGVDHGAFIVAGGANFPVRPPWEAGTKVWWDDIYVLEGSPEGPSHWVQGRNFKLPRPLAYGMTFSTPEGMICAGGCDAQRCYRDVFVLRWDPLRREITRRPLPPLPEPLAFMGGAVLGRALFVAGGQRSMPAIVPTRAFWALDLARAGAASGFAWEVLPPWPGGERINPDVAGQESATGPTLFLFSGRDQRDGVRTRLWSDGYAYDPVRHSWRTLRDVAGRRRDGSDGLCIMAGAVGTAGTDEVLILSGDYGEAYMRLEAFDLDAAAARKALETASPAERPACQRRLDAAVAGKVYLSTHHPGFSRETLVYNTRTDTWRALPDWPNLSQCATSAAKWGDAWVIPGGELHPGIRTPRVTAIVPVER